MNTKLFLKRYSKILVLQMAFVIVILVLVTALRYFNNKLFSDVLVIYKEYFNTDISLSIVLDGE